MLLPAARLTPKDPDFYAEIDGFVAIYNGNQEVKTLREVAFGMYSFDKLTEETLQQVLIEIHDPLLQSLIRELLAVRRHVGSVYDAEA